MAREKCVRCGEQDAYTMNGHKMCYECTIKTRTYQNAKNQTRLSEINERQKERYKRLKAEGICVACGHQKAVENRPMCARCFLKHKIYAQKRKESYDSTGTC